MMRILKAQALSALRHKHIHMKKIMLGLLVLGLSIFLGLVLGSTHLSVTAVFLTENQSILYLRLARIILCFISGAGLGVCGVTLQAILRNPLADPYLLGTSSGAGLAMMLALICGVSGIYLPFIAFLGSWLNIILVYMLAQQNGKISVESLILSGVIISISFSAIMMFLTSIASQKVFHGLLWWLLGNLQIFDLNLLLIVSIIVILGIGLLFIFSQDLNAISLGEEDAIHLGIKIEQVKKILFILTALITGAIVSISGMIGFVGLIIPHMTRKIVGPNHKMLLPATAIFGGTFLILCDTISRSILPPIEIPIGVITALVGAPIFIMLLKRH